MPPSQSADVRKGALVRTESAAASPRILAFQYNPQELRRRLVSRRGGPPREIITCALVFDATDAMEFPDGSPGVVESGVAPQLAALECLLHGSSGMGLLGRLSPRSRAGGGVTLFLWGDRGVPVRLIQLRIVETLHDRELHPIRATARLRMEVLTDRDVPRRHGAIPFWLRDQLRTEALAARAYSESASWAGDYTP